MPHSVRAYQQSVYLAYPAIYSAITLLTLGLDFDLLNITEREKQGHFKFVFSK